MRKQKKNTEGEEEGKHRNTRNKRNKVTDKNKHVITVNKKEDRTGKEQSWKNRKKNRT